jgi:transcriptional regulator with XRE-family HTH domain
MNVLYLPLPDHVPDSARKQLQHRANHSAGCTFRLRQHRAVVQRFRPYGMDRGRGMAATRRIESREAMPAGKADRLRRLLICAFGPSVMKLRLQQKLSQRQELGDMADLGPYTFGPAECGVANVTLDVLARLAACPGTIAAELLTDNHKLEIFHNCYLDARASLARLLFGKYRYRKEVRVPAQIERRPTRRVPG